MANVSQLGIWSKLFRKAEQLVIVYADTPVNTTLISACPSLTSRPFSPAACWGMFGHLQTMYAAVVRTAPVALSWRRVDLHNERGIIVSIDIIEAGSEDEAAQSERAREKERISASVTPVVVIFPGITGGAHRCLALGSRVIEHYL